MEILLGFFEGFSWQELIAGIFFILFALLPGFDFFNAIKLKFGLEGGAANAMVMGVSILLTALTMFLTNSLGIENLDFTLESIIAFGGTRHGAVNQAKEQGGEAEAGWKPVQY